MSSLQNLPVDTITATDQESNVMDMLFPTRPKELDKNEEQEKESKKSPHVGLRVFEDGLLIIILFLVFSLPYSDEILHQYLKIDYQSVVSYIIKAICILVIYWIIKKTYL